MDCYCITWVLKIIYVWDLLTNIFVDLNKVAAWKIVVLDRFFPGHTTNSYVPRSIHDYYNGPNGSKFVRFDGCYRVIIRYMPKNNLIFTGHLIFNSDFSFISENRSGTWNIHTIILSSIISTNISRILSPCLSVKRSICTPFGTSLGDLCNNWIK